MWHQLAVLAGVADALRAAVAASDFPLPEISSLFINLYSLPGFWILQAFKIVIPGVCGGGGGVGWGEQYMVKGNGG